MCDDVEDMGFCNQADPDACVCQGCVDDGMCTIADDCICAGCVGNLLCVCNNDGFCNPWNEACDCADCTNHPQC